MFYNNQFEFEIMHSRFGYESKEKAKIALSYSRVCEYNRNIDDSEKKMCKMAFDRESVTIPRFVELATSGYAFCNLFQYDKDRKYWMKNGWYGNRMWAEYKRGANKGAMKMQFKSEDYYEGCQCFFVDIDYTKYEDLKDYIADLTMKPTIVYMSLSDGIYKRDRKQKNNPRYNPVEGIKSRRFRLCYVFDKVIYGQENFIRISTAINKMIETSTNEPVQDDCGTRFTQYFNGSKSKEVYVTGVIYEMADYGLVQDNITPLSLPTNTSPSTNYSESPRKGQFDPSKQVSQFLIDVMKGNDYEYVMRHYSNRYRYVYRKDDGEWIDGYQRIDEDYFSLFYPKDKWKDGDSRRKKLYERMCLRRIMFPDMTQDEILFNAYVDLHRFVDNTEDPITIDDLVRNVRRAFNHSVDELNDKYSGQIAYLKTNNPQKGVIYDTKGVKTCAERNILMKESRWRMYDSKFDKRLSVAENAAILNCHPKTISRYCKNRGIPLKKTDKYLMRIIDPELSIRENINYIKHRHGLGISKDRVSILIKRIGNDSRRLNGLYCDMKGWFIVTKKQGASWEKMYFPVIINPLIDIERKLIHLSA